MTLRRKRALLALTGTASVAWLVASCSLLPHAQVERTQDSQAREGIVLRQIVQLGFGRDATFAACIEAACPTVTRKTLATAQQIATDSAAAAVDSTVERAAPISSLWITPALALEPRNVDVVPSDKRPAPLVLHFPLGGAALTASDKAALDELIPYASKAKRVVIAARTDNVGSDSANRVVALARANTVRDYLRAKLPARGDALLVDAQGSCCFIASNDTPEGRKQNRRVEILLSVPEQVTP